MKILLIGVLLAAAVVWGLPKIRSGSGSVEVAITNPPPTTATEGTAQPAISRGGKPPGGVGDQWLPRVRQLEEQLRQFKKNHQKKD